jgi:hypothetical protein
MLAYGNILRLGQRYSNQEFMHRANASRPRPLFSSVKAVARRLDAAYGWSAEKASNAFGAMKVFDSKDVRDWMEQQRRVNKVGGRTTRKHAGAYLEMISPMLDVGGDAVEHQEKRARMETGATPPCSSEDAPTYRAP